ncbi:type II secretion system minor pseudopilin GspJ [Desulfurivibrio alkaliphilus]|uniref:Type II secretion system protein J n=1 Tax=Desulfurivibrio alkaliphilus (strain DSM 19089 / UNIQEM U267 / AHT2) TaxID=589865 RepID=D6Z6G0_DESAT|nr:type II secretion system minor pseudopilin GspJ [Desulfurivibrio alkaliphilus]ADH86925.1 general secretion pathway protein J [Desulfurivibrio alkaliphilus AHT 2]
MRAAGGFTLLELLVALALFSVLSMMTFISIQTMLDSRQQTRQEAERLAAVQMAFARLELDLQQARGRGIRDEYGNRRPAVYYGLNPDEGLSLTRGGRAIQVPGRSGTSLQRLRYRLEDGELLRETWPVLDRGPRLEPFRQRLLEGVEALEIRFLDDQGDWHPRWPPDSASPAEQWPPEGRGEGEEAPPASFPPELLPIGVEIWLELTDWGRIRRLIPISRGEG